jgi:hypothetical protein
MVTHTACATSSGRLMLGDVTNAGSLLDPRPKVSWSQQGRHDSRECVFTDAALILLWWIPSSAVYTALGSERPMHLRYCTPSIGYHAPGEPVKTSK